MPKGGYGEGGKVAFSEQKTLNQIFEINDSQSLSYLEVENSRKKNSLYNTPESGGT